MSQHYSTLAFTDHVEESQIQYGSRAAIGRLNRHAGETPSRSAAGAVGEEELNGVRDPLGSAEVEFIAEQDGFYMATTSESGWPYVQFRGGAARLCAFAGRAHVGLGGFPGKPPVHQHRQPRS
jgi:hypothetical protein